MSTTKKLHRSESGIASLIITIVLMVVLSLIVIGFAQISRREQKGSLDRQLSTQAFYAAESGVNDVKKLLSGIPADQIVAKKSCNASGATAAEAAAYGSLAYDLNGNDIGYTCVLVSAFVPQLVKQQASDTDWVFPVIPVDNTGTATSVNTLTVKWTPQTGTTPDNGCTVDNPSVDARNCNYSVLRFEIVPISTPTSRASLADNDMVSYFYPVKNGGVGGLDYLPSSNSNGAQTVAAVCDAGGCSMNINNLPPSGSYYVRIHTMYLASNITVTGANGSDPINFSGAQVQIDSTGKAQDVLRRIRVSYALTSDNSYPQDAIETRDSICKRFATAPGQPLSASNLEPGNNYCGAVPTPLPTPAPDPGNPSGKARIGGDVCTVTDSCSDAKVTTWHFDARFINQSDNPDSTVQSCTWSFGDGLTVSGPASDPKNSCYFGNAINHIVNGGPAVYTTKPPASLCHIYTANLTVHLTNGKDVQAKPFKYYRPYGPPC